VLGLTRAGYPVRLDPPRRSVGPLVGVLSSVEALSWAIGQRRRGNIHRLVAGPNLVVAPDEYGSLIADPAVDVVVTPSQWVADWYASIEPSLAGRLATWPVGIDTDHWAPSPDVAVARSGWLVYEKIRHPENKPLVRLVEDALRQRGVQFRLVHYGQHTQEEYRSLLRSSVAMIYLTETESQGIAQFEAWACDVPILAWDCGVFEWRTEKFEGATSVPYLVPRSGMTFRDANGLGERLDRFLAALADFSPRLEMLQKYTLASAAEAYSLLFSGEAQAVKIVTA
jgi:hypothetical protein